MLDFCLEAGISNKIISIFMSFFSKLKGKREIKLGI